MKRFLLLSVLAVAACSLWAMPQQAFGLQPAQGKAAISKVQALGDNKVQFAKSSQIVSSKTLKNGIQLRIVKDGRGGFVKQVYKPIDGLNTSIVGKQNGKARIKAQAPASNTLYEGFEGWDGTDDNWIPSTWSKQTLADSLKDVNGNSQWHVGEAAMFAPAPYAGDNYCIINFAQWFASDSDFFGHAVPQDEWLITPSFTPSENEKFYAHVAYAPFYLFNTDLIDWDNMNYTQKEIAATLKVLISVDGGAWTQLLDVADQFKDADLMTMFDYTDYAWHTLRFDMAPYVGKSIRIAFEYVGKGGNNMYIDEVRCGIPQPQAYYTRPAGAFFFGFSDNYGMLSDNEGRSFMLTPAYADQTWTNASNSDAETFDWTYSDPTTGQNATSSDADLTVNYKNDYSEDYNWYNIPQLAAHAPGAVDSVYAWTGLGIQAGGKATYTYSQPTTTVDFGVGNYDLNDMFYPGGASWDVNEPLWGWFKTDTLSVDDVWSQLFNGSKVHLNAVANYFEAPTHTYALSKVTVMAEGQIAPTATLNMVVRQVTDDGSLSDTLAVASCKGSDVISTSVEGSTDLAIPFQLRDPNSTFDDAYVTLSVNSAILVIVSGFDNAEAVPTYLGFSMSAPAASGENNGYFFMELESTDDDGNPTTSTSLYPLNVLSTRSGDLNSSFLFNLDANYSWIEPDETDYNAPVEGGSKTFTIEASENTEDWTIDYNTATGDAPDWITDDESGDKSNAKLTFNVAALPDGVKGRSCDVTVWCNGSSAVFHIMQGDASGVSRVETSSAVQVHAIGGDFYVQAPASVNIARIYNLAGQQVKIATISGNTRIDGQNLASGVYVFKFNNGNAVKVVK